MDTQPVSLRLARPLRLRPELRPRSQPRCGCGDARVEQRLEVPRDVVAGIEAASRQPGAVDSRHWHALTARMQRHVMGQVPPGARELQVTLDEAAFEVVLRYRLAAVRGAGDRR